MMTWQQGHEGEEEGVAYVAELREVGSRRTGEEEYGPVIQQVRQVVGEAFQVLRSHPRQAGSWVPKT